MKSDEKKRQLLAWLSLLPVVATAFLIFYFSSESAEVSTQTSRGVSAALIRLFQPILGALDAAKKKEIEALIRKSIRPAAHFAEFALLGVSLRLHLEFSLAERKKDAARGRTVVTCVFLSVCAGVLGAAADEFHQLFTEGRSTQLVDVAVDSAGTLCGVLFVTLVIGLGRLARRRKLHRK